MNTKTLALGSAIALALGISSMTVWAEDAAAPSAAVEATQAAGDAMTQEPAQVIIAETTPATGEAPKDCIPREEADADDKDDSGKESDDKGDDAEKSDDTSKLPYCDKEKEDGTDSSDDKPSEEPAKEEAKPAEMPDATTQSKPAE